jgi:LysR family nitrogen assimilation transcriptional regulator
MNISLRQLRSFVEVAQSRSFSRAAEHLSMPSPR